MPVNLGLFILSFLSLLLFFLFCPFVRGYHMHATDFFMLFGVPMLTLVRLDRFHELICLLSPVPRHGTRGQ